jgi:hypothetical protein
MSNAVARQFIQELRTNTDLYDRSLKIDSVEEMVEFARNAGFDVDVESLIGAEQEARSILSAESDDAAMAIKLTPEEAEAIAGGEMWRGDDAADGHELGCSIAYHGKGYKEKCRETYYCNGSRYATGKCHGPHLYK